MQKKRRLKKSVKKILRITLITFIVILTGISYSLVTDADEEDRSTYPAYQNTISIDTQSFGKLSLSVTAEEHILPKDTKVSLKEVTDTEYKNIQSKLQEDAEENNTDMKGILLYDLSFTDSNTNEIPSFDGTKINVYASYEKDASALTENNNEDVSVKLINKDQQYTVTDLTSDDYKVDTDDNNAVKDMSMTVHGSTYYALVWSKRPEITVHAVDEAGNELIPSDTIQLTDDEYTDTFTPSVEGYSLTSVTGDNTEITKVKPEKGKLYYNNGDDWFEASDSNVYFHYVSNNTSEDTDSNETQQQTVTEEVTEPETEETTSKVTTDNRKQLTETSKDKKYTVTVTYGDDAGLPEGTTLSVTGIDTTEEKYADAKKAVAESKNVDADTLGMEALDITLLDADGNKVEPSNASDVQVSISVNDLPDNVDSVEIHHITDTEVQDVTADTVAEDVGVSDNSANAEFSVSSFSVFTITWEKPINSKTGSTDTLSENVDNNADEETKDAENGSTEGEKTDTTESNGSENISNETNDDIISTPAAEDNKKTITSTNGLYTITYDKDDENISDTASVAVKPVEDEDKNNEYKQMVADAEKIDDLDSFSMSAMDISIVDDGTEVEPSKDITVSIDVSGIVPDDATDVQVHHIINKKAQLQTQAAKSNFLMKGIKKLQSALTGENTQTAVDTNATYEDGKVSFTTSSLSVFTITWKDGNNRVASVKLHYVDESGEERSDPTEVPTQTIASTDTVVTISTDWAKTITNYDYVDAHLSSVDGTAITGMKVNKTTSGTSSSYALQYTSDGSTYSDIPADAITGSNSNVVNVYLVYKEVPHFTIHYVNKAGTEIATSFTKYANTITAGVEASTLGNATITYTDGNKTERAYTYETNGAHLSSALGVTIASVKAVKDDSTGLYTLQYRTSDASEWTSAAAAGSNADIYMLYNRADARKITIHYTDLAGVPITANGMEVTKVIYPDEWTSSDYTSPADKSNNRYVDLSNYAETFEGYTNWDSSSINAGGRGLKYGSYTGKTKNEVGVLTNVRNFRWIRYDSTSNNLYVGRGSSNSASAGDEGAISTDIDVYMLYPRLLRIHFVDASGDELYDPYTTSTQIPYDDTSFSSAVNLKVEAMYNGHGTPDHIYAYNPSDSAHTDQTDITSIAWKWNSTAWQTQLSGTDTVDSLISDVYMVYPETYSVTVHHVNEAGNALSTATTTVNAVSGRSMTYTDFATTETGYTANSAYFVNPTTAGATAFSNVTYTNNTGEWGSSATVGETTDTTLHNEVWVKYTKDVAINGNIAIHHVDAGGHKVAADTSVDTSKWAQGSFTTKSDGSAKWDGTTLWQSGYTSVAGASSTITTTPNKVYLGNDESRTFDTSATQAILFHYDSASGWQTAIGTQTGGNETPSTYYSGLIMDVTKVYNTVKGITVHHVDVNGKTLAADTYRYISTTNTQTIVPENKWAETITGYSVATGYVDNDKTKVVTELIYTPADGSNAEKWQRQYTSGETKTTEDLTDFNQEIWLVYTQQLSQHYGYMTSNENGTTTFNAFSSSEAPAAGFPSTVTGLSSTAKDVTPTTTEVTHDSKTYKYAGTYLATPKSGSDSSPDYARLETDAPRVTSVRVVNGKTQYAVASVDNQQLSMVRRGRWSYTSSSGRSFTLRDNSGNLSLIDSQTGTSAIDLMLTSADGTTSTYTGSFGTDTTGTVYTVTYDGTNYHLTVSEWRENNQTHLYHVYRENGTAKVTLTNSMVFDNGNLTTEVQGVEDNQIISYTWYRSDNNGEFTEVARKQSGTSWNVPHDLKDRKYLNVITDEGTKSKTKGRDSVRYYVTVKYTDSEGKEQTITSNTIDIPYYDQLENGSFEDSPSGTHNQTDAEIWKTTASDGQIEVINTTNDSYLVSYAFPVNSVEGAADKKQFAELNANTDGALYQDVATIPGTYLNYWLSHRARGGVRNRLPQGTKKYDTMYLVIMPTSVAMTSAADGGELTAQSDIQAYITEKTGSWPTSEASGEENQVVYRDDNSGVLIVKISSDTLDWHSILAANGYMPTSSVTRFFFVAGYCSYQPTISGKVDTTTHGNFIDAVGFSQDLPTPTTPHFHVIVTKTFEGLTASQVASLAGNFKYTINEYENADGTSAHSGTTETDDSSNTRFSLNGAVLDFTATASGDFVLNATAPAAVNGTTDLFSITGSGGEWSEDSEGNIVMQWTLYDNYIYNQDQKYFKITESGADLSGFSIETSSSGTLTHAKDQTVNGITTTVTTTEDIAADTAVTPVFKVVDRDIARVNYTNVYRDNTQDDPNKITIQKTFTGITPTVVSDMMGGTNPYSITVTNPNNSAIKLLGNKSKPFDGNYPGGVDDVTLDTNETTTTDGSITFTWTITGTRQNSWVTNGSYKVVEDNYTPSGHPVTAITLNSNDATETTDGVKTWKSNQSVSAGETSSTLPTVTDGSAQVVTSNVTTGTTFTTNKPNLIIAKYTSSNVDNYLVWTPQALGINEKQAVFTYAKNLNNLGASDAEENAFHFRSGVNPGTITTGSGEAAGKLNYNSETGEFSLADGTSTGTDNTTWLAYYAANYSLTDKERATEVRIVNSYEPAIRIMKVDKNNNSTLLGGAQFVLYKTDSENKYLTSNTDAKTTGNWSDLESSAYKFTTATKTTTEGNAATLGIIELPVLPAGTYYLEEVKAPNGYNMPTSNPVATIKVNSNGVVTVVKESNTAVNTSNKTSDDIAWCDWNSPYYTITVSNTPGYSLPNTGGKGTTLYIALGGMILIIAGWLGLQRARKRGTQQ